MIDSQFLRDIEFITLHIYHIKLTKKSNNLLLIL